MSGAPDLMSILGAPAGAPSASAAPPSYRPLDLAVRLAMLEDAKSGDGQAAVAGTMANRAKAAKGDLLAALTAPGAYEPWSTKQKELAAIDPNSDAYKAAAARVLPVLQGKVENPVGEAINFYSPESQAALAGDGKHPAKPDFDDGSGVRIGGNLFFGTGLKPAADAPPAGAAPDLMGVLSAAGDGAPVKPVDTTAPGPTIALKNGKVVFGDTEEEVPLAQSHTLSALVNAGRMDAEGKIGGVQVHMQRTPQDTITPGDFYIEAGTGKLKRSPGGPQDSSLAAGLAQGVEDVGVTGAKLLPQDNGLRNALEADQAIYGARYGGDPVSGAGRLVGQGVGATPLLAGVEAPLAAAGARAGLPAAGEWLAARGIAPGLARFLGGAATLSARGAAEGAGAAGFTSSADDAPVATQMERGAVGGALLSPLIVGGARVSADVVGGARNFLAQFTDRGANRLAEEGLRKVVPEGTGPLDVTEQVPGSRPTLAEAVPGGHPGLAQLQRSLSDNSQTQRGFLLRDEANNQARQEVVQAAQGDPGTVADLARTRASLVDAHKGAVLAAAGPADSAPVVAEIDAGLASPEASNPEVQSALTKLRGSLVTKPEAAMTPAEHAAFGQRVAREGWGGTDLSPEGMQAAQTRLGKVFSDVADKTGMAWDDKLRTDIGEIVHAVAQTVPEGQLPPIFKTLDDIASTANQKAEAMGLGHTEKGPAEISGASYQALTNSNGPLARLAARGDDIGQAARDIRGALDDALERSAEADPEAKAALADLRTARAQYKNLKTVEKLLPNSGVDHEITPEKLLSAARRSFATSARTGAGPLGDLAESEIRARAARAPTYESRADHVYAQRDALQSTIDKLQAKGETDDASRAAAQRLTRVRDALDQSLERANPDYARFRAIADSSAEPIEAQRYLQSLALTTNGKGGGTVTLNLVNRALDRIEKARSLPGPHPAKAVSDHTITQLQALKADLERQANRDVGKARGSDTHQLLTADAQFGAQGLPLVAAQHVAARVPIFGRHLAGGLEAAQVAGNQRVMTALANRMLTAEPIVPPRVYIPPRVREVVGGVVRPLPGALAGVAGRDTLRSRLLGGK